MSQALNHGEQLGLGSVCSENVDRAFLVPTQSQGLGDELGLCWLWTPDKAHTLSVLSSWLPPAVPARLFVGLGWGDRASL